MNELKMAVVGLGLGRHFVAAGAGSSRVGRLVVCDPNQQLVEAVRKGNPRVAEGYAEMSELLEVERPDVVCVVTPDHLHRPHVMSCLQAGCDVLMTKPLATTLEDAEAIVRAAEESKCKVMVAHERRFRSRFREMKRMLEDGSLGEVVLLQLNQISDRRKQFAQAPWYASKAAGRTAIVGSGIHEVDLLRFLIDRPIETISASSNRLGGLDFPEAKTTATVFGFEGGAVGQTAVSYEAHWPEGGRPDDHLLLVATRGVVFGRQVKRDQDEGWQDLPRDPIEIAAGIAGAVNAFIEAVVEGHEVPVGVRDGYATLAACIAADEAAATGRVVRPSLSFAN